jgi:hypothetical protein
MKIHTGDKAFVCSTCDRAFRNKYMLKVFHMLPHSLGTSYSKFKPTLLTPFKIIAIVEVFYFEDNASDSSKMLVPFYQTTWYWYP